MAYRAQIGIRGCTSRYFDTLAEAEAWLEGCVELSRVLGLDPPTLTQTFSHPDKPGEHPTKYSPYVSDERAFCSCEDEGCDVCNGYCEQRATVRTDGRDYCAMCDPFRA